MLGILILIFFEKDWGEKNEDHRAFAGNARLNSNMIQ